MQQTPAEARPVRPARPDICNVGQTVMLANKEANKHEGSCAHRSAPQHRAAQPQQQGAGGGGRYLAEVGGGPRRASPAARAPQHNGAHGKIDTDGEA